MADLILAFDTAAAHCAAAVLSGDQVLAEVLEPMAKGQAERLFPLLEELLATAGAGWRDLSALGVGIGPGNFTGVRISVAAARGLAVSLGVPAVGVSTLEGMAHGIDRVTLATLDAKRDQIYLQLFDGSGAPPVLCDLEHLPLLPTHADPARYDPAHADPVCVGFRAVDIAARVGGHVAEPPFPLAVAIARIARARRHHHALPRPTPLYLRNADAAPAAVPPLVLVP